MSKTPNTFRKFLFSPEGERAIATIQSYANQIAVLKRIKYDIDDTEKKNNINIIQKQKRISELSSEYDKKRNDKKFLEEIEKFNLIKKEIAERLVESSDINNELLYDFDKILLYNTTYDARGAYGKLQEILKLLKKFKQTGITS